MGPRPQSRRACLRHEGNHFLQTALMVMKQGKKEKLKEGEHVFAACIPPRGERATT
ncbi:hypothetical protein DICSQDRAFT_176072 [Dichomitus squalens LYAD-421 SS1]|uniref:Uncharacterized protein n=1 Tax=Dichomitus squalens (strain LYAD-421) TaxID=732165 RepID=R7SHX4_DICSQ|nr:uncharacterized protein DICSQDRAFT_176072 [Dichomitus squalens LYAD-421 SS1]EJF55330.1 hypothetical protein DICSQDRAFT_176072 [Dichomitus squalens LYAD-421 SS1]